MDMQGINKRLKAARVALDRFIDKIIDEHLGNPKVADAEDADMVDDMLAILEDSPAGKGGEGGDLQGDLKLTRDNIKAIIMDVMFGGTETVASAIEWAMSELKRNPEGLKRVQQELTDLVGLDRKVRESDLDKLPYFKVMINVWAIGRDKAAWKDPETFRPSRFGPDGECAGVDFRGNNFELLPFGSGRRSCPGLQLGMYALELAMAQLMHCFDWSLPDGMKPSELDMGDSFGLQAPRAFRLVAVPTPRLNCPLF
ncbi:putative Cytochrome P450 84A1 [Cocos nucifera]|uniref:Putative Cytochrome P450 84A1 n=1 Tax=Cocos nucifera TaxID=13894 RepID=A0A8K0IET2_COCNU|nr:putative Cytochrome P450 84A1 [Cocos nucifera]